MSKKIIVSRDKLLKMQLEAAKNKHSYVRQELADLDNLLPEVQLVLAKDPKIEVREELAVRTNICGKVQQILAQDKSKRVVEALVKGSFLYSNSNPNVKLTAEVQNILAKSKNNYVRAVLAENLNILPEIQLILAKDKDFEILGNLALNPKLTLETQLLLAENEDLTCYLEDNYNLAQEVIDKIIKLHPRLYNKNYITRAINIVSALKDVRAHDIEQTENENLSNPEIKTESKMDLFPAAMLATIGCVTFLSKRSEIKQKKEEVLVKEKKRQNE